MPGGGAEERDTSRSISTLNRDLSMLSTLMDAKFLPGRIKVLGEVV